MPAKDLPVGKLPGALLGELLRGLPAGDAAVRLRPALGEDAAAIDVPAGTLVATTDPITLTAREAGRYAVLINANDVAVTGAAPRWFLATVLLPPGTDEAAVRALFDELVATLETVGASAIGGHTEVTPAVSEPVVVGFMLGLVPEGRVVGTGGARPGDLLLQVGPAPVEGAAVLAAQARERLTGLDGATLAAATAAVDDPGISVVAPALRAAELGASAMHDPTEGGLATGLHELAVAAEVRLTVDGAAIDWFAPGVAVCDELGGDPWATLASGCLLATFPPRVAAAARDELAAAGHPARIVGEVAAGPAAVTVDGRELPWPAGDEVARLLGG